MPSPAHILASIEGSNRAIRWDLVGKLGKIRRRDKTGTYYLDFRPYGRIWSNRGIPLSDEGTARRLLEQIRGRVAEGEPLSVVLPRYQPTGAKLNRVSSWLDRWIEIRRRECESGTLSPGYLRELERLAAHDGHFSFFVRASIHEFSYGVLEDWSLWLADRGLGPKSRKNILATFRAFLRWLHRRGELREVPEFPRVKVEERDPRILGIADQAQVLGAIPEEDRGIFLALAHLGLRPGEARALTVADYHDGWLTVDKAVKGKTVSAPVRGTKTGRPKRLPVSEELQEWIEHHVRPEARLTRTPLFPNPRTGGAWAHKGLQRVWNRAVKMVGLPAISLYEGTKHSFATDTIRRGVSERHLQRFLGHKNVESTRRYARLADTALLDVLRMPAPQRQASDKGSATKNEKRRGVSGGPSRTRTWYAPWGSAKETQELDTYFPPGSVQTGLFVPKSPQSRPTPVWEWTAAKRFQADQDDPPDLRQP